MDSDFKHPLARKARIAVAHHRDGAERNSLVIVTTLELDPKAKGYNRKNIDRLREAAKAFLDDRPGLESYTIVNRPKDWDH